MKVINGDDVPILLSSLNRTVPFRGKSNGAEMMQLPVMADRNLSLSFVP